MKLTQDQKLDRIVVDGTQTCQVLDAIGDSDASAHQQKIKEAEEAALQASTARDMLKAEAAKLRSQQQAMGPLFGSLFEGIVAMMRMQLLGANVKTNGLDFDQLLQADPLTATKMLDGALHGAGPRATFMRKLLDEGFRRVRDVNDAMNDVSNRFLKSQSNVNAALFAFNGAIQMGKAYIHATQPPARKQSKRKKKAAPSNITPTQPVAPPGPVPVSAPLDASAPAKIAVA